MFIHDITEYKKLRITQLEAKNIYFVKFLLFVFQFSNYYFSITHIFTCSIFFFLVI